MSSPTESFEIIDIINNIKSDLQARKDLFKKYSFKLSYDIYDNQDKDDQTKQNILLVNLIALSRCVTDLFMFYQENNNGSFFQKHLSEVDTMIEDLNMLHNQAKWCEQILDAFETSSSFEVMIEIVSSLLTQEDAVNIMLEQYKKNKVKINDFIPQLNELLNEFMESFIFFKNYIKK